MSVRIAERTSKLLNVQQFRQAFNNFDVRSAILTNVQQFRQAFNNFDERLTLLTNGQQLRQTFNNFDGRSTILTAPIAKCRSRCWNRAERAPVAPFPCMVFLEAQHVVTQTTTNRANCENSSSVLMGLGN